MIHGHVRDNFPRLTLALTGREGPISIEFLIDTGFDGSLALPTSLVMRLNANYIMDEVVRMADGTQRRRPVYETEIDWNGASRSAYILVLDSGMPLLGVEMVADHSVYLEMTDGGEVTVDQL